MSSWFDSSEGSDEEGHERSEVLWEYNNIKKD